MRCSPRIRANPPQISPASSLFPTRCGEKWRKGAEWLILWKTSQSVSCLWFPITRPRLAQLSGAFCCAQGGKSTNLIVLMSHSCLAAEYAANFIELFARCCSHSALLRAYIAIWAYFCLYASIFLLRSLLGVDRFGRNSLKRLKLPDKTLELIILAPLLFSPSLVATIAALHLSVGIVKTSLPCIFSTSAGFDPLKLRVDLARAGVTKSNPSVHANKIKVKDLSPCMFDSFQSALILLAHLNLTF